MGSELSGYSVYFIPSAFPVNAKEFNNSSITLWYLRLDTALFNNGISWDLFWDSAVGAIMYLRLGYISRPHAFLFALLSSCIVWTKYLWFQEIGACFMPLFLFIFVPSTWGLLTSSAPTFGSLRPPCSIWLTSHLLNLFATSLPLGGTFPPIPVWFRRFLSVVLRTFVLLSFLVVCSAAVKNWVWVRALPLAIWTTLASFLLLPNLSLSVKADSQVPVLQGCWEGQWDSAGKLLSSVSGNVWLPVIWNPSLYLEDSLRLSPGRTASTFKAERPAAAFPSHWDAGLGLHSSDAPASESMSYVPALQGVGVGMSPVGLGSSKNSQFSTVAVETGPVTMSSPDLPCGGILAVVLLCGLS